ncbi:alpha/beta-hydrolase [Aspergillus ibericus CBS 121593]|uniref:Alpha/beta-hydrolase n=1 Tax=Aspergillus ibericus CBS 121593 TaxID=1448316 RepID=A0A395GX93_9EURO|nr:alpha/beta-hydrolase [Aspergillus ibericus CBS 121593]RAL00167.1 alpha/beta-hydrolase [Aspergillus ibericus CBS 121593]
MTDPSQEILFLQGPSPEWVSYCIANKIPTAPVIFPDEGRLPYRTIQKRINDVWETSSRHAVEVEGLNVLVQTTDYSIPRDRDPDNPIRIRAYTPNNTDHCGIPLPVYVHFHGGGFLSGNLDTEDATCARPVALLAACKCPMVVISVQYRVTSEAPYPAAFRDAWDVYEFLEKEVDVLFGGDPRKIILGGTDSGAALVLWVAVFANSVVGISKPWKLTITGLMLCSPWLPHMDKEGNGELSRAQNVNAPLLPQALHEMFRDLLAIDAVHCPTFVLNSDTNFTGLPKTSVHVPGQSLLRDQGMKLINLLAQAGVEYRARLYPGLPHDFRRIDGLWSSREWDLCITREILWFLGAPGM